MDGLHDEVPRSRDQDRQRTAIKKKEKCNVDELWPEEEL